mgnify:CR=1 FL=1
MRKEEFLNIKKIEVIDLFDYYCYEIEIKAHNSISIIHAPNGYGKTTVFKMITYLLDFYIAGIATIPFNKFIVEFSKNIKLSVQKTIFNESKTNRLLQSSLNFEIIDEKGKAYNFDIQINSGTIDFIKDLGIDEYIRRTEMRRRNSSIEEREVIENYVKKYERFKEQLDSICNRVNINFIDSNRLFVDKQKIRNNITKRNMYIQEEMQGIVPNITLNGSYINENETENIIYDAKDILYKIQEARQRYSLESEKKDRDFPDRLVEYADSNRKFFDDIQIAEQLEELEQKRLELEKAGLVLSGKKTLAPTNSIDDTMRKFYTLYIQDTFEKLSLYDEIKAKLELFIEIINTRTVFSNKFMRIDNEKGVVFEPIESKSGKKHFIPLEKLSSGEKHDFIMFYELIFNSDKKSVFLIDEPEISLHVAWQMEFVSILKKICELNGGQAIIATHSPDIVNGHDNLLISLGVE